MIHFIDTFRKNDFYILSETQMLRMTTFMLFMIIICLFPKTNVSFFGLYDLLVDFWSKYVIRSLDLFFKFYVEDFLPNDRNQRLLQNVRLKASSFDFDREHVVRKRS